MHRILAQCVGRICLTCCNWLWQQAIMTCSTIRTASTLPYLSLLFPSLLSFPVPDLSPLFLPPSPVSLSVLPYLSPPSFPYLSLPQMSLTYVGVGWGDGYKRIRAHNVTYTICNHPHLDNRHLAIIRTQLLVCNCFAVVSNILYFYTGQCNGS